MPKYRKIVYDGKRYSSVTECAEALGLTRKQLYTRIKKGVFQEKRFKDETGKPNGHPTEWNGIKFNSMADAARFLGISPTTMHKYVKNNWKKDSDVIRNKSNGYGHKQVFWGGLVYKSVNEAARCIGINPGTLSFYIKKGYSSLNDLPEDSYSTRRKPVTIEGKR